MEQEHQTGLSSTNTPAYETEDDVFQADRYELADARFGLDLVADGAWKVMLGLEVLRDHQKLFSQAGAELARTENWVRQMNQELDALYDALPDWLERDN
ncbi:hypothetical protein [Alicyclobacillus sp. SO9]|uniref:hypothetical protein n=1 Tax=Alicyclobacillus sp. SO9 TaxID=2665646 RepID=UPI0018E72B19|nr:hypothetical protein [Alicyclobacillus sp. SO9]QQE78158.1 hypothetical protein GI364_20080 [Alicyclobacillus sp. SO9]